MERLSQKLKSSANLTLILGLLSITWLIIDYFVIETILKEGLTKFSLEWILLVASAVAFAAFHISVFITIFYAYRLFIKLRSESKKKNEEKKPELKSENNEE
jgi:NADH:ubiquinone oxidoreductase subunit 5 (subunit L)/multisubunit Na+/H+ antiporter MnhA subunit